MPVFRSQNTSSSTAASALAAALVVLAGFGMLAWANVLPKIPLAVVPWKWVAVAAGAVTAAAVGSRVIARLTPASAPANADDAIVVEPLDGMQTSLDSISSEPEPDGGRLVAYVLHQAIAHEASDIHLVPYEESADLRFRIDGAMTAVARLPSRVMERVTNRLKVLSGLPPYVRQRWQDGRFSVSFESRRVDVRSAFMPTLHGERIVLRILERADVERGLAALGLSPPQHQSLTAALARPQGLVIFTGPAGSGKTTAIYCALRTIVESSRNERSVCTLEDPIEYDLANINQTAAGASQGLTFASGLRTMLRQDPDVIMVGEIRDLETARTAVQAGLTGHLILTTVHAKRASAAFLRLTELGMDAPSVAASVTLVLAQRLVRRLCPHCRAEARPTPGERQLLGEAVGDHVYFGPRGCRRCGMKGYLGRLGLFEVLDLDEDLRARVARGASPEDVQRHAVAAGMQTLIDSGLRSAREGETSLAEVVRVTPAMEART